MDTLAEIVRRALTVQPRPQPEVVIGLALMAVALVSVGRLWRVTQHLVTITHEGSHAAVALFSGHRLGGITLHRDTSGLTKWKQRHRRGIAAITAAGYLGPAVVGLVASVLLAAGYALALLWLIVIVLGLMLLQIRNLFGFVLLVVVGAAMVGVTWYLSPPAQSAIAYLITWVLLIAAPKDVWELMAMRRRQPMPGSDVDQLGRLTHLPGGAWAVVFLIANLVGLVIGIGVLVPSLVALVEPLFR